MRLASPAGLTAVTGPTAAAYAPYTAMLGSPPLPVTENYAPRIEAGEVWLLDDAPRPRGPDHAGAPFRRSTPSPARAAASSRALEGSGMLPRIGSKSRPESVFSTNSETGP